MNGGFVHERVIIDRLQGAALQRGVLSRRQVALESGRFMDLLIDYPDRRIGVEVELTARRVLGDLQKAAELGVDELWIVVPDVRTAGKVNSLLARRCIRVGRSGVFVLTLGLALQRLTSCFPKISGSLSTPTNKKQIAEPATSPKGAR